MLTRPRVTLLFLAVFALAASTAAGVEANGSPLRTLVTVSLPGEPATPALDGQSLWVSIPAEAVLLRLDARSGRRLTRIDLNRANRRAFGGGPVAARQGIVWIAAPVHVDDDPSLPSGNSGWVGRLDSRTRNFRVAVVTGDAPAAIAAGPAGVWVCGGHTLRQVDPRTGRVIASVRLGRFLGEVVVGTDAVWVTAPHAGTLLRVDPRTRKIVRAIGLGPTSGGGSLALGSLVWAATNAGVVAVDPRTNRVVQRVAVARPNGIAVDGPAVWAYAPRGLYSVTHGVATRRLATADQAFGAIVARDNQIWLSDAGKQQLRRVGP